MALDECDDASESFGHVAGPLVPDRGALRGAARTPGGVEPGAGYTLRRSGNPKAGQISPAVPGCQEYDE